MFLRTIYITWALLLIRARCSIVRDALDSSDSYLTKYCPPIGTCPEGSHVLCLYYNPQRVTGVRCSDPMNVTMSRAIASQLLEVSNAVRSKIALGKETGKKDSPLPKAYGMNKLHWSNELATFAQIMANQCILRHDLCRATEKFEMPGQTAGLVRFRYPDWKTVSKKVKFPPGLIPEKLTYATTQVLNSWYQNKKHVLPEWIKNCPDWRNGDISTAGKVYLEMIYYKATHMGCGIIAYTEYAYHDNNADVIYNSVQIICNFSAKPIPGQPIYDVIKPDTPGHTVRCGCPPGFNEDESCLCIPGETRKYCDPKKRICKSSVVLMPIFTVEDAPPDKTAARFGPNDTRVMVIDQDGPREIRYDMLRPIPNDTDGPHYELVPQDGLSQSLALVPILEQVQNDLPDAKIYWNQPEDNTIEPLYGTLRKTKGELPRIELFRDQIDIEALALQKFAMIKNEEAQLDLARTLLIKSYDDLMQSITPKLQEQNILQIYNKELLKQIANYDTIKKKKIQKQPNMKIIMSKDLKETERSSPRFEFLRVQRDLTNNKIPSNRRNSYSLPVIELPMHINTQSNQSVPQYYMLSQTEEIMPSMRYNLNDIQKKIRARESTFVLPKIRPISENINSLPRIELVGTKTKLPVNLRKDFKKSRDKLGAIDVNQKITKSYMPFKGNSLLTPRDKLDKINHNSHYALKNDKIVRQFVDFSWSNKSTRYEPNKTLPQRTTNHVFVPHQSSIIAQSDWRVRYSHDHTSKSSKPKKSLIETIPHQNLRSQSSDSKLARDDFRKPQLALIDVIHVKDSEEHFMTNDRPLEKEIQYTSNKKTDESILEESLSYSRRYGEQPQTNDDSKLCRLKGGKLICDVPMEPLVLKESIPNAFLSRLQRSKEEETKITSRLKLTTKQKPSTPQTRILKVKKVKTSDEEETPDKYQDVDVESKKKYIFKNKVKKKRIW